METKIMLEEDEIPKRWYNIQPDLPKPLPPVIHPGTKEPIGPEDLAPLFPMELIKQEVSQDRWIDIPEEVREAYTLWRPTPLYRATRLEKALKTPAKIYYKYEGVSPPGSHKPNTAIAQAYFNLKEGVTRLATETGAGQWGSALSFATNMFGLKCTVYMVRVSYEQKPYRRNLMNLWGAEVHSSPTDKTQAGRKIREEKPNTTGSLGISISESVEDAATHDDTKYSLGSVLNHVLLHQTIVGLEAKEQLAKIDEYPDLVTSCCGGGSNFAGISLPFLHDKLKGDKPDLEAIAVEPTACPTLTKGIYRYDFGDTAMLTPLIKMYTLGHDFVPPGIHAGGLRYHGDAPIVCFLYDEGIIGAKAYNQNEVFEAATLFGGTEGICVAPETAHAVKLIVDEARKCKETGEEKTLLFNCSGHGHFDMAAYEAYYSGKLEDYEYPAELVQQALAHLPEI
ncbi:MAG: TrpB-like pyridoxal phosphate-dependent enzyme [Candidatus Hydrothermarchaeaceae archaeon]